VSQQQPPLIADADAPCTVHLVDEAALEALKAADPHLAAVAGLNDFTAAAGSRLLLRGQDGLPRMLFGLGKTPRSVMGLRALAAQLPAGDWRIAEPHPWPLVDMATAFALGAYQFDRYKSKPPKPAPRLVVGAAVEEALRIANACALARDLVNTPASDMGPAELEAAARGLAKAHGAEVTATVGPALLEANYPSIHAVGRAAGPGREPRLLELHWTGAQAASDARHVVLVGKGVTFDTGGLDLKPSSAMRNMKKDMGGAAHVLGLAQMIMEADLGIRLTVLIPAVENAVSGDAMRPGDILATRKGLSVEVGNTDAEGRLILSDALTRADELAPDLTLDLATLTGAARMALGPEVIPFYTDDDDLAARISYASRAVDDPTWRMPLWEPYDEALDSDVADLKNDADGWAQAGSVTAALFLRRFAPKGAWAHFDIFAWNPRNKPGRSSGGEAQVIRALFHMIRQRAEASV
jgi:leucyl aminopeptidase